MSILSLAWAARWVVDSVALDPDQWWSAIYPLEDRILVFDINGRRTYLGVDIWSIQLVRRERNCHAESPSCRRMVIVDYFHDRWLRFEHCSAALNDPHNSNVPSFLLNRPKRNSPQRNSRSWQSVLRWHTKTMRQSKVGEKGTSSFVTHLSTVHGDRRKPMSTTFCQHRRGQTGVRWRFDVCYGRRIQQIMSLAKLRAKISNGWSYSSAVLMTDLAVLSHWNVILEENIPS